MIMNESHLMFFLFLGCCISLLATSSLLDTYYIKSLIHTKCRLVWKGNVEEPKHSSMNMQGKADTQYKGINWEFIPDGSPHLVYKSSE